MFEMCMVLMLVAIWKAYRKERRIEVNKVSYWQANFSGMVQQNDDLREAMEIIEAMRTDEVTLIKKENATLKRQLAKRKGDDTKRAKRLGRGHIGFEFPYFYGYSVCGSVRGPRKKTRASAKRAFETILGLRGKIKWAAEV